MTARLSKLVKYDFSKHIVKLSQKPKIKTLSDLHYNIPNAPCQFAVTEPFRLFTKETAEIVVNELQNEGVAENCFFSAPQSPLVIRGAYNYSPFLNDLWRCTQLSQYVSDIIGTNVIPHTLNDELGHVNVQIPSKSSSEIPEHEYVFNWHLDQDSPIVLIVMLSDIPKNKQVKGNSTLYKDGLGNEYELEFKDIGYAYILHGTQIAHAAKPGINFKRLTGVCGYKIDDESLNGYDTDLTCLGNAISFSEHKQLSKNYYNYRLQDLQNKIDALKHNDITSENDYYNNFKALLHLQEHMNLTVDSYSRFVNVKENERPQSVLPPKGIFD